MCMQILPCTPNPPGSGGLAADLGPVLALFKRLSPASFLSFILGLVNNHQLTLNKDVDNNCLILLYLDSTGGPPTGP